MVNTQKVALVAATTIITVLWTFLGYWFFTNLAASTQLAARIFWGIFLIIWLFAPFAFHNILTGALVKNRPIETLELTCFCEECKKTVPVKKARITKTGYMLIFLECDHTTGFVFSGKLFPIANMRNA